MSSYGNGVSLISDIPYDDIPDECDIPYEYTI